MFLEQLERHFVKQKLFWLAESRIKLWQQEEFLQKMMATRIFLPDDEEKVVRVFYENIGCLVF